MVIGIGEGSKKSSQSSRPEAGRPIRSIDAREVMLVQIWGLE
jgi:hypothetical protein